MANGKRKRCARVTILAAALIVVGLLAARTPAQTNGQERAANLRAQLVDTQAKQAELQSRLQQLDEEIKPDNIERSLAGVGSVHPEELREARRRQLETEKRGIQSQLDVLAATRSRLEAAIAAADAEGYRQSAGRGPNLFTATDNIIPGKKTTQSRRRTKKHRRLKRH
jgi:uncharacterized protein YlxW (UPF0749 family)